MGKYIESLTNPWPVEIRRSLSTRVPFTGGIPVSGAGVTESPRDDNVCRVESRTGGIYLSSIIIRARHAFV